MPITRTHTDTYANPHPGGARAALTPEALALIDLVARRGSFAAAARELGRVPSALTYSVRKLEEALDVLLFDRSSRVAKLTPAGIALLEDGRRLLDDMDRLASRVKRVATGWEAQLTIALDSIVMQRTVQELIEDFYRHRLDDGTCPQTALQIRVETLAGTWDALASGNADLVIGATTDVPTPPGVSMLPLGEVPFVFAVAPHHPLASATGPISDASLRDQRMVVLADSTARPNAVSVGILPGQPVLTVPTLQFKLDAQLRGLGCGFLPEPVARPFSETGRLVIKETERQPRFARACYAWRAAERNRPLGRAMQWWLTRLASPTTRAALLEPPASATGTGVETLPKRSRHR